MMDDDDLDRTFRVNFTNDGAAMLRESVREKLKEFMGDYTDDTLVEYVIVLLRNGRRKDEARNELNVFLGDDTDAFVSWLWDHLSVHLHLYVPQQESYIDQLAETKPAVVQDKEISASPLLDSDSERETSIKESKSRRNRDWKGLVRDEDEPPPLRSSEIERFHIEKKSQQKPAHTKRYRSPQPPTLKRSRHDDRQPTKREVPSRPLNDASRRLLQFAVRDAVGTTRPSVSRPKPTLKRLRSVVSTSTADITLDEAPQRIRSVPRLSSAVTTAFKAAAEAAEDVSKVRGSANVFDRLGHSVNVSGVTTHASDVKEMKDVEYVDFDNMAVEDRYTNYHEQNEYAEDVAGNTVMLERNADAAYDSASDNDGYLETSQTARSYGPKDDDSLTVQYSVAENTNEIPRMRVKDQNSNPIGATTSRKIVNISVNVNTWKPSHYQVPQDAKELKKIEAAQVSDVSLNKPGNQQLMNESKRVVYIENEKNGATIPDSQKTPPSAPGSYSLGHPSEDADSRTIFVSNVHFAATKDTLSRHFNKFGEVLKVVIVTDSTTGQPTGSAYVEFMRKGAAELALSLNGTSFMSRILKVVRKTAAYPEPSNVMTWPRGVTRASPYGVTRLARSPFPRGMTAYRGGRLAIKPGARSLQWKRESSTTPTADATVTTPTTPTARSLTYVRKDATKPEVNVASV